MKDLLLKFKGKVIGLTATPLRSDGINPIDTIFEGYQLSEYGLIDAMQEEIIEVPKYICGIYEINEDDQQRIIKNEALKKKIENYNIQNNLEFIFKKYLDLDKTLKLLVFVSKVSDIPEFKTKFKDWFIDRKINFYQVHSYQKNHENTYQLECFEKSNEDINIMFSVNILGESLHLDSIDATIFLRKTNSSIVYEQQFGRILNECIENPIIFDLVNNIYRPACNFPEELKEYKKNHSIDDNIELKTKSGKPIKIFEESKDIQEILESLRHTYASDEKWKQIEDDRFNLTILELSKKYGVKNVTIHAHFKKCCLDYKGKRESIKRIISEETWKLVDADRFILTIPELSKRYNIKSATILCHFKYYKLDYKRAVDIISEETWKQIEDDRFNLTIPELSKKHSVSIGTIHAHFRKYRLDYKRAIDVISEETWKQVEDDRFNLTILELSKKYNIKSATICSHFKKHKLDYKRENK